MTGDVRSVKSAKDFQAFGDIAVGNKVERFGNFRSLGPLPFAHHQDHRFRPAFAGRIAAIDLADGDRVVFTERQHATDLGRDAARDVGGSGVAAAAKAEQSHRRDF